MKALFSLAILFLLSCNSRQSSAIEEVSISKAQKEIQSLVDSFKLEYSKTEAKDLQDSVVDKYNQKIYNFLNNNYLDSIRVHIDSIIIQGSKITTKCHCNKDIAFQYGLIFDRKSMNKTWDSVYHFMKGLKMGSDTTISFAYIGSHQLNNPYDTAIPVLKIFAFPTPKFPDRQ